MAANPKETTAIIRENAADHALRPLFMRFEWTRCIWRKHCHVYFIENIPQKATIRVPCLKIAVRYLTFVNNIINE